MRYHLSPETGEPKPCRAKPGNCPHGEDKDHFGTEEAAREYYEKIQRVPLDGVRKGKTIKGHYDGERDVVDGRPGHWSTSVTSGWGPTERPIFFADDAGLQDDPSTLPDSFADESWREVQRPTLDSSRFIGFAEAQREALAYYAGERYDESYMMSFDGPVSQYTDEFAARLLAGEKSAYEDELYQRNFRQMSPKEKAFSAATREESGSRQPMDLLLAFPDRDLAPVLERLGVEQVSVTPLKNTREVGLVYTVMTPSGSTRSFSVYEHRNTDAAVISGEENWDPEAKPYGPYATAADGTDSKWNMFAEFSVYAPKKQVAESLGYLLKSAQSGTLESDQELIAKAEKLDWGAILSEQIPAFGEWLGEKKKAKYESQEFIDQSFEAWENSF